MEAVYTGIDVSKLTLDVSPGGDGHQLYPNHAQCFDQLLSQLPPGAHCVLEASGPYYLPLANFLHGRGVAVSVVNPLVIKRFSQMRLLRAKTDKADARMIAAYGASQRLFQSGTSVRGKSHICKLGMGQVRRLLYLCTWSAVKVNLPCQRLYERLLERGKPKMLALIAVANKLLRQAFAMARHQTKFKDFKPAACFYTQFILEGSRVFKAKPKLLKIANDRS